MEPAAVRCAGESHVIGATVARLVVAGDGRAMRVLVECERCPAAWEGVLASLPFLVSPIQKDTPARAFWRSFWQEHAGGLILVALMVGSFFAGSILARGGV